MNWLIEIMNKPKLQVTFMDEMEVFGFILLVVVAMIVAWAVVSSWFAKKSKD